MTGLDQDQGLFLFVSQARLLQRLYYRRESDVPFAGLFLPRAEQQCGRTSPFYIFLNLDSPYWSSHFIPLKKSGPLECGIVSES